MTERFASITFPDGTSSSFELTSIESDKEEPAADSESDEESDDVDTSTEDSPSSPLATIETSGSGAGSVLMAGDPALLTRS